MLRPRDPLAFAVAFAVMTLASVAACSCPPGAQREPIPFERYGRNDFLIPPRHMETIFIFLAPDSRYYYRFADNSARIRLKEHGGEARIKQSSA